MHTYHFQVKLDTVFTFLSLLLKEKAYPFFECDGISFEPWGFNWTYGHHQSGWLIKSSITAVIAQEAYKKFTEKLERIIPRIAMLSQGYAEYQNESLLIHKDNVDIAYFFYSRTGVPGGLDCTEDHILSLGILLNSNISDEFYYYWHDMLNTTGYSAKFSLICSALEALAKSQKNANQTIRDFINNNILQDGNLADRLYANKIGNRHRFIHGDYFLQQHGQRHNDLNQVYQKVIAYFNKDIFQSEKIKENIVCPQRHPFNNKDTINFFIKRKPNTAQEFCLKQLVEECKKNDDSYQFEHSEVVIDDINNY